ncbi:hypothetical protein X975_16961, partial [Stegodyphus mimosarum]
MRFLFLICLVFVAALQCWSPAEAQTGGQRLADRIDQMLCQTSCPLLSSSHRDGCCKKYHYNRCC